MDITDNHFHLDPSGNKEHAVKEFLKAGGTRLVLVHKPYLPWKKVEDFKDQVSVTLKLAEKARMVGAKVAVVSSPHPIELLNLLEYNTPDKAQEIYLDAVDYCTNLVNEKEIVGLGELGRPHFEVDRDIWNLSNETLISSLSRAKDVDAAVVLHTESGTPEVMTDLSRIANEARFPKSRLVKHYGSPAAVKESSGLVVSLISSMSNITSCSNFEFMLETDYLDDPKRPGAVMGPKTVPRKTRNALNQGILSERKVHRIHTELPDMVYRKFT